MRRAGWVAVVAGAVLAVVAVLVLLRPTSESPAPARSPTGTPSSYATAVVRATNAARTAAGLDALAPSSCATAEALRRADALRGSAALEHASLDPVLAACRPAATAAENLSRADAPAQDVVAAWMGSPGHRKNILDPTLTQLGVGCVLDGTAVLCSEVFVGP